MWAEDANICLEVSDEGRGFEPADLDQALTEEHTEHIGLRGMRDRVAILGGRFALDSQVGTGTHIYVELPGN